MAYAENRITVPRPGPAVYAFLTDLDHISAWIPAVRRVDLLSGAPGEVGSEYEVAVDVGGGVRSGRLAIARIDPPTGMTLRIAAAPIRMTATVRVDDEGESSRVAVVLDAPTHGLLRLMDGPLQQALQDALAQLPGLAPAIAEQA
jgi:carbon monoxide dehydrogenase subunit G